MKHIHFLGIGGSGASGAAAIAKSLGFAVSGCDKEPFNEFTKDFDKDSIQTGHNPSHLFCHPEFISGSQKEIPKQVQNDKVKIDILAVTPAIFSLDPNNPELLEAKKLGIPILTWQQFVGEYLTKDKFIIAICGTHGKSTTTAMIAKVLEDSDLDPTVLLGAINPKWGTNYRISNRHPELDSGSKKNRFRIKSGMTKEYFIIEADEFNDNFLHHFPNITVVTNIEMDHPEYFKDINAYLDSFEKFLLQTKQTIVANLTDKNVAEIVKDVMKESRVSAFDFNKIEVDFDLKIPGEYNISNARAAFSVGLQLGIESSIILQSLNNYSGIGRRFEHLGQFNGAEVYSDFGHHPTEIEKTMKAAREKFPNRKIWLIYQPHMFSRTKALFDDFVKVFKNIAVDKIIITDIYPSREVNTGIISSQELVTAINNTLIPNSRISVKVVQKDEILKDIKPDVKSGDIIFFMGAGDIDKFARELVKNEN